MRISYDVWRGGKNHKGLSGSTRRDREVHPAHALRYGELLPLRFRQDHIRDCLMPHNPDIYIRPSLTLLVVDTGTPCYPAYWRGSVVSASFHNRCDYRTVAWSLIGRTSSGTMARRSRYN
jgi:hypothetical protein